MFETVQNEQHPFGAEIPDELLSRIICPAERKAEGVGDSGRQQTSRRNANKRNKIDAVLEYVDVISRQLGRQPGLAYATNAGQCNQTIRADEPT